MCFTIYYCDQWESKHQSYKATLKNIATYPKTYLNYLKVIKDDQEVDYQQDLSNYENQINQGISHRKVQI